MKKIILSVLTIFMIFTLSECKKKTYTLDPPASKLLGISGTWELRSVVQVDELDLAKAERDISSFYINEGTTSIMKITFNSSDMTFEVSLGESGKNYLPDSGSWSFDNNEFPKYVYLDDGEGNVTTLSLQGPTRPQDQELKFSFKRSCLINEELLDYVGYRYEFNRK